MLETNKENLNEFDKKAMAYYAITQQQINDFLRTMVTGVDAGVIQEGMRHINLISQRRPGTSKLTRQDHQDLLSA